MESFKLLKQKTHKKIITNYTKKKVSKTDSRRKRRQAVIVSFFFFCCSRSNLREELVGACIDNDGSEATNGC